MDIQKNLLDSYENIAFNPLLTDAYQLSMGKALDDAIKNNPEFDVVETFELFFRKNPFDGQFAIAGGMSDAIKFISGWKFTEEHELLMKIVYGDTYKQEYYDKLRSLDTSSLMVNSVSDGDLIFANEPMISLSGNSLLIQLMETTLLNIIGHATLVTTLSARIKLRCPNVKLLEFGCRRAQGASAAINSARYSYIGGFDATSNVLAGAMYGIPVSGTHAHSFVMRFVNIDDVSETLVLPNLKDPDKPCINFKQYVLDVYIEMFSQEYTTHQGELGAFIQYAYTFPSKFLALIDTYNTRESGIINYCAVAIALIELGYTPIGVRLDSGDLATLSININDMFKEFGKTWKEFNSMTIVASNDLDEQTIQELVEHDSKCSAYGIGTNLATSKYQPSLGCVYKIVDRAGIPRIKKSEEFGKTTIPGKKYVHRLFNDENIACADIMSLKSEMILDSNEVNIFDPKTHISTIVKFSRYESVLKPTVVNGISQILYDNATREGKIRCIESMKVLPDGVKRFKNPDTYIVGVDAELYNMMQTML
jgi:nicotinate phosphoribosyltransferase